MIRDEIRERMKKRPFEPFRINTVDRKHYDIVRRFSAVAMKTEMFLALPNGHGKFLQLAQVASIEDISRMGDDDLSDWV